MKSIWLIILATMLLSTGCLAQSAPTRTLEEVKGYTADGMVFGYQQVLKSIPDDGLVLLSFWSIRCAPCLQSMPKKNLLAGKYKKKGLRFLMINTHDKPEEVTDSVWEKCSNIQVIFDDDTSTYKAFGKPGWGPVFVFNKDSDLLWHGFSAELHEGLLETLVRTRSPVERKRSVVTLSVEAVDKLTESVSCVETSDEEWRVIYQNKLPVGVLTNMIKNLYGHDLNLKILNAPTHTKVYNIEFSSQGMKPGRTSTKRALHALLGVFGLGSALTVDTTRKVAELDMASFQDLPD